MLGLFIPHWHVAYMFGLPHIIKLFIPYFNKSTCQGYLYPTGMILIYQGNLYPTFIRFTYTIFQGVARPTWPGNVHVFVLCHSYVTHILVPRGRTPFGQHQESRPLAVSNNGSPRFTDFLSLCACLESNLTNLIGSGLNLLCLQFHSKPECRWSWPEVAILGADQKERGFWGREWCYAPLCE